MIVNGRLTKLEVSVLRDYHRRESPERRFDEWLEENKSVLVNPFGKVYYPSHPSMDARIKRLEYGEECIMRVLKEVLDGALDIEAYATITHDALKRKEKRVYTIQSAGECHIELSIWNPDGKLIYELWLNKKK